MIFTRIYTDGDGETHLEEMQEQFSLVNYAPPAPPFYAAHFNPAVEQGFIRIPPGWYGDWHPVPRKQIQIILEGEIDAQVSDGIILKCGPGGVVLVEDTGGKGHKSWVVGDKEVVIFVVVIPE